MAELADAHAAKLTGELERLLGRRQALIVRLDTAGAGTEPATSHKSARKAGAASSPAANPAYGSAAHLPVHQGDAGVLQAELAHLQAELAHLTDQLERVLAAIGQSHPPSAPASGASFGE
jgi:uncharacterized protein YceH (UPF0502 family)